MARVDGQNETIRDWDMLWDKHPELASKLSQPELHPATQLELFTRKKMQKCEEFILPKNLRLKNRNNAM